MKNLPNGKAYSPWLVLKTTSMLTTLAGGAMEFKKKIADRICTTAHYWNTIEMVLF